MKHRGQKAWEPSEVAWTSVESKWLDADARREYMPTSTFKGVKHTFDNPQRRDYDEMILNSDTPPVLVGRHGVLMDGHHRVIAARRRRLGPIPAVVVHGLIAG